MADSRIVIKASLENNEDIRRFSVPEPNFAHICDVIKQIFSISQFIIKYKDPEGDLVMISNDLELTEALRVAKGILRVFLKQKIEQNPLETIKVLDEKQKAPIAEKDNSFFGAKVRGELKPLWKIDPEIAESRKTLASAKAQLFSAREKTAAAKKELLDARVNFVTAKRTFHEKVRAAREKRRNNEKSDVSEEPKKMLARFVKHVSIPENTKLLPNTEFVKTWRFRNESNRVWPAAKLIFVGKNVNERLSDQNSFDVGTLAPGQEKDISITMKTPATPGNYESYWRLFDPETKFKFGHKVAAKIIVIP